MSVEGKYLGPGSTDAELEEAIRQLTEQLKGPLPSQFERMCIYEDRKLMRDELEKRRARTNPRGRRNERK